MRMDRPLLDRLDVWRGAAPGQPSRPEAIRRLVDQALATEPWSDGEAPAPKAPGTADFA